MFLQEWWRMVKLEIRLMLNLEIMNFLEAMPSQIKWLFRTLNELGQVSAL
jgi:hypothetical protein